MEPARRRNAAGGGFGGITRKTTDEVLNRMKGASRGQAALGALLFSAVFLALTFAVVEWIFGGAVDVVFIAMEIVHFFGILVLMRKLLKEKSCEGLSLRTQENTAAYLVARVISGALFEGNHHTLLDFLTLAVTALVIYFMNTSLKSNNPLPSRSKPGNSFIDSLEPSTLFSPSSRCSIRPNSFTSS